MKEGPGAKALFEAMIWRNGRGERIRTSDPLVPNQVRYQTALRPELMLNSRRRLGAIREPQEALDRIPT
jgi:hypothetical protein